MTATTPITVTNVRVARPAPKRPASTTTAPGLTSTGIIVTALALTFVGLVMILSSSSVFALNEDQSAFHFVGRQALWVALGLAAMIAGRRIDHRLWRRLAMPLMGVTVALLVAVLFVGRSAYGARRWFEAGPLSVQPSELAKLAVAVFLADLLTRRADRIGEWRHALRPVVLLTTAVVGLVMLQPDMGTSICLLLVVFGAAFAAAIPVRHIAGFGGGIIATGALLAWSAPYRRARLLAYRRPFQEYAGDGYQVAQSLVSLGNGGPAGTGLGQGRAKWGFLPNAHTDFIFSVIGEETGLIGTGLVLGLFIVLAGLGFRTAIRAPDRFGSLLAAGITSWLVGQAALNIGTTVGLVPVTGVPLPFISFGGSALVISLFAAGILASIARASER